jgi:hypothetical protein
LLIALASAASGHFDYDHFGDDWSNGDCGSGTMNSPIDFLTGHAVELDGTVGKDIPLSYNNLSGD